MKKVGISIDSMPLPGVVRESLKNWWVVLFFALAAFLGSTGIASLTYTPQYTASATLVVRIKGSDAYTSLTQASRMTGVYQEVFQSSALRKMISQSIGEEVVGTINCSQVTSTNLLVLSATSPTPRQAYLFIHAALENYEQVAGYVFSNIALEIVQEPSVPETPSNTSLLLSLRIPLTALAAVCAIVLISLIYLLRNTLKTASKASLLLDGKILGTIPYEQKKVGLPFGKKKGIPALLLYSPLVSMRFAESNRRTATRLESHLQRKEYKVILVASVAENEGKSTVAANIAITLAEHGRRVLLIDGDFRKPALWRVFDKVNTKKLPSFSDVVLGKVSSENAIVQNDSTGIWELFQYKAIQNPSNILNSSRIEELLCNLRNKMDYIIIDCSPVAVAADAELWMHHVDSALLVVRQDVSDVRIINDTVDMIWKSTGDFSGFVLNAFTDGTSSSNHSDHYGAY